MQIDITARNIELTDVMKEYTQKKIEKLKPHEDIITHIKIVYHEENANTSAEGFIHVPGEQLIAKTKHETVHGAMDGLIDMLVRSIIKYKSKQRNH